MYDTSSNTSSSTDDCTITLTNLRTHSRAFEGDAQVYVGNELNKVLLTASEHMKNGFNFADN